MGNLERIKIVAQRIAHSRAEGQQVVAVVSAMQGETDRLLQAATALCADPSPRETDQLLATGEQVSAALLALALGGLGIDAQSFTGTQLRLTTDGAFCRARIHSLDGGPLLQALQAGRVGVATGFQGVDRAGNLTTLGRGGSDTSAVAIAAALHADACEIYTDVLGVYTADPNICPNARKLDVITYDEMMEMASLGAKVLQIRSVELAMNHRVKLRVRSTFNNDPGTLVVAERLGLEHINVTGISHAEFEAKLTLRQVPDVPGTAARIFGALAVAGINVDVIVQNLSEAGFTDLSFTVGRAERPQAQQIVADIAEKIGAKRVEVADDIGKVSIVGVGMMSHPGVAAQMFAALQKANVNIQIITTSEIKVTCVVARADVRRAVVALHDAFALHQAPQPLTQPQPPLLPEAPPKSKRPASAGVAAKKAPKKPAKKTPKPGRPAAARRDP
jgi:aspartate kinase